MIDIPIAARQFLFGALVSLAVILTIVKTFPEKLHRSQRIVAAVIGGALGALMIYTGIRGEFSAYGGWVCLPIVLIAPVLYVLEYLKRKSRRPPTDQS